MTEVHCGRCIIPPRLIFAKIGKGARGNHQTKGMGKERLLKGGGGRYFPTRRRERSPSSSVSKGLGHRRKRVNSSGGAVRGRTRTARGKRARPCQKRIYMSRKRRRRSTGEQELEAAPNGNWGLVDEKTRPQSRAKKGNQEPGQSTTFLAIGGLSVRAWLEPQSQAMMRRSGTVVSLKGRGRAAVSGVRG